jgi:hypothetical protein
MRFSATTLLPIVVSGALSCGPLWSQSTSVSQISGTVQDSTGLVVPGTQITVTQTDTGLVRSTASGPDGAYLLPGLPVGPYRLEAKKEGFTSYIRSGIVLQVSTNPAIDISLTVGSVSEQVQVEAGAAMVETHTTAVGQVVDAQRVVDLPLNGRQATDLILVAGASTTIPSSSQLVSTKNYPGEAIISVAGGGLNGLSYLLDGGNHNDPFNNLNLPLPFPDALQEFKVETSALPAQYGHHSAGAVNIITKSGTNEFHGNAFEFVRNYSFNARDFFALSRDTIKRNQFGGTIGGPILKNKLFFFAGYQNSTLRAAPSSNPPAILVTPDMLKGDFSTIASAECNGGKAVTMKAPFVNNQVPVSLFVAPALKMISYFPTPTNPCGLTNYTTLNNSSEYMGVAKVDYQLSSSQSIFVRYFGTHALVPSSFNGTQMSVVTAGVDDLVQAATIGHTYIFGPSAINSFRGTFNRSAVFKTQVPVFTPADLGINMTVLMPKYSNITVSNAFTSAGGFATPGQAVVQSTQIADDVTWIRGAHQMSFGVSWIRPIQNGRFFVFPNGGFTSNGQTTGLSMGDFLLGNLSSFQQQNVQEDVERWHSLGIYAQDSWRVTSRLTVNYGVRWEPYFGGSLPRGQVAHFDRGLFDQGVRSQVYVNAPVGVQFPGDAGFDTGNRPNKIQLANFAPRLGVVWDPQGNGRMTVRASYGLLYDFPDTLFFNGYTNLPPWGGGVTLQSPPGGLADPWKGQPGGNPFPTVLSKNIAFPNGGGYLTVPLNPHVPYVEQYNLSLQKQFGVSWLASASYLGTTTVHGWTSVQLNPGVYIPGGCVLAGVSLTTCSTAANVQQRRVLSLANPVEGAKYGGISGLDDGGTGSYNGLLLSLQHRLSNHFTVLGNYTWSHCISDNFVTFFSGSYSDPANRRFDRSNCPGIDARHNVNLSAVLESPKFSNRLVRMVAGDWKLSVIARALTGSYFNVTTGTDTRLTAVGGDRPNLLTNSGYCDSRGVSCWLNPKAFNPAGTGLDGNVGNNAFIGPGYFDVDLGLSRAFPVRERQRIEIRAEAFNVQNRVNFNNPTGTLNSALFGKIQTDKAPRIMQFAIKYTF